MVPPREKSKDVTGKDVNALKYQKPQEVKLYIHQNKSKTEFKQTKVTGNVRIVESGPECKDKSKDKKPEMVQQDQGTIVKFFSETSLHGFKYLSQSDSHAIERIFWALSCAVSWGVCIFMVFKVFEKWNRSPIIVTFEPSQSPIWEIPFPALTLCNLNKVMKSRVDFLDNELSHGNKIYDKERKFATEICAQEFANDAGHDHSDHDHSELKAEDLNYYMSTLTQPCESLITGCSFESEKIDCSSLFKPYLTDEGMCCSFNIMPAALMMRQSEEVLSEGEKLSWGLWNPQYGYGKEAFAESIDFSFEDIHASHDGHDSHGHDDHGHGNSKKGDGNNKHTDHGHGYDDHGHGNSKKGGDDNKHTDHGHGHGHGNIKKRNGNTKQTDHGHDDHGHGNSRKGGGYNKRTDHGHEDHGHGNSKEGNDENGHKDHGHSHDNSKKSNDENKQADHWHGHNDDGHGNRRKRNGKDFFAHRIQGNDKKYNNNINTNNEDVLSGKAIYDDQDDKGDYSHNENQHEHGRYIQSHPKNNYFHGYNQSQNRDQYYHHMKRGKYHEDAKHESKRQNSHGGHEHGHNIEQNQQNDYDHKNEEQSHSLYDDDHLYNTFKEKQDQQDIIMDGNTNAEEDGSKHIQILSGDNEHQEPSGESDRYIVMSQNSQGYKYNVQQNKIQKVQSVHSHKKEKLQGSEEKGAYLEGTDGSSDSSSADYKMDNHVANAHGHRPKRMDEHNHHEVHDHSSHNSNIDKHDIEHGSHKEEHAHGKNGVEDKSHDEDIKAMPLRNQYSGLGMGLSVDFDIQDFDAYCSAHSSLGVKALLHSPVSLPKMVDYGFVLEPGKEVFVSISPNMLQAKDSINQFGINKRECYLHEEKSLNLFSQYTYHNCLVECEINITLQMCKCVTYFNPKAPSAKICSFEKADCVRRATKLSKTEAAFQEKCQCLPGCTELNYQHEMTNTKLGKDFLKRPEDFRQKHPNTSWASYVEKNIIKAHFFFKKTYFIKQQREEFYGFVDFFSNIGGLIGLFMGFSMLSLTEIFYFFTIKLYFSARNNHGNQIMDKKKF